MRVSVLIIALLVSFSLSAGIKKNQTEKIDSISQVIESGVPRQNYDSILNESFKVHQEDSSKIALLEDSIAKMANELHRQEILIAQQEKMLSYGDTCLVILALRRCREPYNEAQIKKALAYFEHISSSQLKKDRADVYNALNDYTPAYKEVIRILQQAQSDVDRVGNPFRIDEYKQQYIRMLQSSMYYNKYVGKKGVVQLPALEDIINTALERLGKHSEANPADFSDLILTTN